MKARITPVRETAKRGILGYASEWPRSGDALGLAVVVLAAVASLFASGRVSSASVLLFPLAGAGASAWAAQRPRRAAVAAMVVIALVPVYWSSQLPGFKVVLLPAVVVSFVLLPAALRNRHYARLTVIDRLVVAFVVFRLASLFVNYASAAGLAADTILQVALPYVAFRLLSLGANIRSALAAGMVVGGAVSAVIALREYAGVPNPFFPYRFGGYQYTFYAHADSRFGRARPEAAFGQAIPLGMFLAAAAVLALAFAWHSKSSLQRYTLYAVSVLCVAALANTLVRGPLVMLAVAVVVALVGEARRFKFDRAVAVAVAVAALFTIGSLTANVSLLRDASDEQGTVVQSSGEVRFEILDVMARGENFSFLGKAGQGDVSQGFQRAVGDEVGLNTFENAFALIYLGYGVFALLAFTGIAIAAIRAAFTPGLTEIDRAWSAVLVGAFVNLIGVGLVAQFGQIFWIMIAVVASLAQEATRPALERTSAAN